ncbi:hypothetical protein [Ruicaihuangia caeni]|uniref:Uncharacterized protein n=1 Tax=Ruicaihuangia caeni TaxID=3042517 RepID=A0AAW6T6Z4_9MICO|nr:hypothetical protein [Klugiella sp. YN-L-19]MDI2098104.1 hypothetical protein [Klugiella sp. YN-L-19]
MNTIARWSVRTVHDAELVPHGIRVEHSSVPAIAGLELSDVAAWQIGAVADHRAALSVGSGEASPVGPAGALLHRFEFLEHGVPRRGVALFATIGDTVHWVVADAEADHEEDALLAAAVAWLAAQASVLVSALELRVLTDLLGLDQVAFVGARWYLGLPEQQRTAVSADVFGGLLRRGMLSGDPESPLAEHADGLVRTVLDGDHIVVITITEAGGETEVAVAARSADEWMLLRAEPDGMLRLTPVFGAIGDELAGLVGMTTLIEHAAALDPGRRRHTTIEQVRHELAGGSELWRGALGVHAIRRSRAGLESVEHSWLLDDAGAVWRVDASLERGDITLEPVGVADVLDGLHEASTGAETLEEAS